MLHRNRTVFPEINAIFRSRLATEQFHYGGHRTNLLANPRQSTTRKLAILTTKCEPDFCDQPEKNPLIDVAIGPRKRKTTYRSKFRENFTVQIALIYDHFFSYGGTLRTELLALATMDRREARTRQPNLIGLAGTAY